MRRGRSRRIAAAALLAAGLGWAGPASAGTETLARGAMNLVGTPLDIALFPVTTVSSLVRKFYMVEGQSTLAKVMLTPIVGTVYGITCVPITGAVAAIRFTDGLLNVPVGLAVLGSDVDPGTSLYEPVPGRALVDHEGIYFGGYHCEGFFQ